MRTLDLLYFNHNRTKPAGFIHKRHIPYNELTVVIKGRLDYTIGGARVSISDGEAIFIPSGTERGREANSEVADYVSFNFTTDEDIELPLLISGATVSDALLIITALDSIAASPYYNLKDKAEHLLAALISVFLDRVRNESFSPLTRQIIGYIHDNLGKRITLSDIGRLTFFSPIYCDAVFKRECGKSIINYLIDRRIDEAKRLIMERATSLSDIAEAVGFGDYNYFSRIFKRRSGYSPSEYRRMITTGEM